MFCSLAPPIIKLLLALSSKAKEQSMILLALILSTLLALAPSAALASSIDYVAPTSGNRGELRGDLPLNRIGTLLLPRGLASFTDGELKILAVPRWLFDRNLVLKGAIIRAELVSQPSSSIIGGLVYFYDGLWLSNLAKDDESDVIDTMSDTEKRGRIVSRTDASFVLRRQDGSSETIAFSDIKTIRSPRAFTFNIVTAPVSSPPNSSMRFDTNQIVLSQTRAQHRLLAMKQASLPASNLSGTEPGISKRAIATFVAFDIMSIIAPAIVAPLVLNHRTQLAGINAQKRFVARQQAQSLASQGRTIP
jgi:hypothetical protein